MLNTAGVAFTPGLVDLLGNRIGKVLRLGQLAYHAANELPLDNDARSGWLMSSL